MSRRIAWVVEESETDFDEGPPRSLGVFSGHVEGDDLPDAYLAGPRLVAIDEILRWAREHAPVVIVRYDAPRGHPHEFSAGGSDPDWPGGPLPRWPPPDLDLSPRVMPGWEYMERTEQDPPISWDVVVQVTQGWGSPVTEFAATFAGELESSPAIGKVEWKAGPGGGYTESDLEGSEGFAAYVPLGNSAVRARFSLEASTADQAVELATREGRRATDAALVALGVQPRQDIFGWSIDADAYPSGSDLAAWNLSVAPDD